MKTVTGLSERQPSLHMCADQSHTSVDLRATLAVMTDDAPEQVPLDFGPLSGDEDQQVAVLTVNQLVAYNLMRARRQKGWTQQETAKLLTLRTTKKWTAATLSAAERSWQTGRSRQFDANELVAFSEVFQTPIVYFFIPIRARKGEEVWYALSKVDAASPFPTIKAPELLDAAVPLRYPSALVDQVSALRKDDGVVWSPSARVDWYRPEEWDDYEEQPDEEDEDGPTRQPDTENAPSPHDEKGVENKDVYYTFTKNQLTDALRQVLDTYRQERQSDRDAQDNPFLPGTEVE